MGLGRVTPPPTQTEPVTVALAVAESAPGFRNLPPKEQALARSIVAGIVAGYVAANEPARAQLGGAA